jgi:hypothetical protein
MKTRIGLVLGMGMVLILTVAVFGQQGLKLTAYAGYSLSAFEHQNATVESIPLGLSLGFKAIPAMEFGVEFFYPIGGYQFELEESDVKITTTYNQMMAGGYGKYVLGSGNTHPFLKAGIGYYMGDTKIDVEGGESDTSKMDGAIGFNIGGGIQMQSGLSLGFTYNIVTREKAGMNTWAILAGYPIIQ